MLNDLTTFMLDIQNKNKQNEKAAKINADINKFIAC